MNIFEKKLYYREKESLTILESIAKLRNGENPMLFLSGPSGIGKTVLFKETVKNITPSVYFLAEGDFSPFDVHLPFSGVMRAIQMLTRQLLSSPLIDREQWKQKLLKLSPATLRQIIDFFPEVEKVSGKITISFEKTFREFLPGYILEQYLITFISKQNPLIIFLDNLQYADHGSFRIITDLIHNLKKGTFLFAGCLQDDISSKNSIFYNLLTPIQQKEIPYWEIKLAPLSVDKINNLLLFLPEVSKKDQAQISADILQKTAGKPFLISEYLKKMTAEQSEVETQTIAAVINKIEIAKKPSLCQKEIILSLEKKLIDIIIVSSCTGVDLEGELLSYLLNIPLEEITDTLSELVNKDIFQSYNVENEVRYKFTDIKISSAAYSLIKDPRKSKIHYRTAKYLMNKYPLSEIEKNWYIFPIVNNLNRGLNAVKKKKKIMLIAGLNLKAGIKARQADAPSQALHYINKCLFILSENRISSANQTFFLAMKEKAICKYYCGEIDRSEKIFAELYTMADSVVKKGKTNYELLRLYIRHGDYSKAIKISIDTLAVMDVYIPLRSDDFHLQINAKLESVLESIKHDNIDNLENLPQITDPKVKMELRILIICLEAAYVINQDLFTFFTLRAMELSIRYGSFKETPFVMTGFSVLLCGRLGEYKRGYQFAKAAIKFNTNLKMNKMTCRLNYTFAVFISHWHKHISESVKYFEIAFESGIESGDLNCAGRSFALRNQNEFIIARKDGVSLLEQCEKSIRFLERIKNKTCILRQNITKLLLANLTGQTAGKLNFDTDEIKMVDLLKKIKTDKFGPGLAFYNIGMTRILYLYGNFVDAHKLSLASAKTLPFISGTIKFVDHFFYNSLIMTALYEQSIPEVQYSFAEILQKNLKLLRSWSESSPDNYRHKYMLVQAEFYRLTARETVAMSIYDKSIEYAETSGFFLDAAIANELAGLFYYSLKDFEETAERYLKNAYLLYRKLKFVHKTASMIKKYPKVLEQKKLSPEMVKNPSDFEKAKKSKRGSRILTAGPKEMMEYIRSISAEMELRKLLERVITIFSDHTHLDRALLFIKKNEKIVIVAECLFSDKKEVWHFEQELKQNQCKYPHILIAQVLKSGKSIKMEKSPETIIPYLNDEYLSLHDTLSLHCFPLSEGDGLNGLLYLESYDKKEVVNPEMVEVLNSLAVHCSIALKNSLRYEKSERMRKALEAKEKEHRVLFDNLQDMYFRINMQGSVVAISPSCLKILNMAQGELLAMNMQSEVFLIPSNFEDMKNELDSNGYVENFETWFKKKDSQRIAVSVNAHYCHDNKNRIVGIEGMVRDISLQKETENEILKFKTISDNANYGTLIYDPEGIVIYVNSCFAEMHGYLREEIKGMKFTDFHPEDDSDYSKNKLLTIKKSKNSIAEEIMHRKKDNSCFPVLSNITPIRSDDDELIFIAGTIIDFTEFREKDRQLIQAQKMETIGNLAGGLAHDFNNVLGGITGTISLVKFMLRNGKLELSDLSRHFDLLENSSDRAADMVKQLLTLSRKSELTTAPVDLNMSLKHVLKICNNTFDKSIEIKTTFSTHRAMVDADPTQIEQVLLNLCVNASHAMTIMRKDDEHQGGVMNISVERIDSVTKLKGFFSEAKEDSYWDVAIRDNGIGMTKEVKENIFEPFFTTKGEDLGTGLGLAMVNNIIKNHNGFIEVFSEKGLGSTFHIYLPVNSKDDFENNIQKEEKVLVTGEGKILVVDDEEIMRITARNILEECGYTVLVAENGIQGIEIFKENFNQIKLVLMDMSMPKMSGKESYIKMKEIDSGLKALIVSGFSQDKRIKEVLDLGADDYIQKPYTMYELAQKIKTVIMK